MTGPQLRIIRECAGLSQLALGKMLGISQTWVSRFERGLSLIPPSVAEKVAMVLPKATLEAQTAKTEEIRARENDGSLIPVGLSLPFQFLNGCRN